MRIKATNRFVMGSLNLSREMCSPVTIYDHKAMHAPRRPKGKVSTKLCRRMNGSGFLLQRNPLIKINLYMYVDEVTCV